MKARRRTRSSAAPPCGCCKATAEEYKGVAKFFSYLSSPEVQADWHQFSGYLPITTAAYELTKEQGFYEKNPGTETAILQMTLRPPTELQGAAARVLPPDPRPHQNELEHVFAGRKPAQVALDDAGVAAVVFLNRSWAPAEALAQDAIGDHRNCALKYRLVRNPVPLEEAAQRFDSAYRLLLSAPPDDISTPDGPVRVVERHSCAYGAHRFGHVILQYRGRVVSLLVTANDRATAAAESAEAIPHVIGRPMEGLSVVSVNGSRHAVMLVSDLEKNELTQLAGIVSLPLAQRLADATSDRTKTIAWLFAPTPSGIELLAHPLTQSQFAAQGTLVGEVNGLDLVLDLHN